MRSLVRRGSTSEVVVETRDSGVVILPIIYYDFYRAESSAGRRLTTRDSLGLLTLTVAPGRQTIRVAERLTLVSWLGLAITAASCLAALGYSWRRRQPVSPGIPFPEHTAPSG